jgi:hypothetical protein
VLLGQHFSGSRRCIWPAVKGPKIPFTAYSFPFHWLARGFASAGLSLKVRQIQSHSFIHFWAPSPSFVLVRFFQSHLNLNLAYNLPLTYTYTQKLHIRYTRFVSTSYGHRRRRSALDVTLHSVIRPITHTPASAAIHRISIRLYNETPKPFVRPVSQGQAGMRCAVVVGHST